MPTVSAREVAPLDGAVIFNVPRKFTVALLLIRSGSAPLGAVLSTSNVPMTVTPELLAIVPVSPLNFNVPALTVVGPE